MADFCIPIRRYKTSAASCQCFPMLLMLIAGSVFLFSPPGLYASGAAIPEIPKKYQDADAIVLQWEQSWNKAKDGTVDYKETKRTLIRNDRAIRAFGDVRIPYHQARQALKILKARTVCSDGRIIDVPTYAINEVSPRQTSGWPDFAEIRMKVISFSGIEPGAVLELSYGKVTQPGFHQHLEIECRLSNEFPTLVRRIQFPDGKPVREFKNLDAVPSEPQSISWREGEDYLWYSDCSDERTWASSVLTELGAAARPVKAIKSMAEEWSAGASDPLDRAYAIQERLQKRVSVPNVPIGWGGDRLRGADKILASNYASPAEASVVLLALFRAAGLEAEPFFVVREEGAGWVRSAIAEYGVALKTDTGTTFWHMTQGRIRDPGPWGGWKRYDDEFVDGDGAVSPSQFELLEDSRLFINLRVKLDAEAKWSADLNFRATGLFVPGTGLRTEDQKKTAVKEILKRTLRNAELKTFTVTTLSETVFAVSAKVEAVESLDEFDGHYFLELSAEAPWTSRVSFPLNRSRRKTPMRLAGPFRHDLEITLEMPDQWSVAGRPTSVEHLLRQQRSIYQGINIKDRRVTIRRGIEIGDRHILPEDYSALRKAINELLARRARVIILSPGLLTKDLQNQKP